MRVLDVLEGHLKQREWHVTPSLFHLPNYTNHRLTLAM